MEQSMTTRPEVLAPAGDLGRLKAALQYGADAVYLAGKEFGMRGGVPNFDPDQLAQGVALAHQKGVKVYVTANTLQRNDEIDRYPQFVSYLDQIGVDGVIINDMGALMLTKQIAPNLELHISTQSGITNYQTARAFYELGAKRVVLARELSLEEIAQIRAKTPADLELEVFVHGAMCMSISGRCLISNYLTDRDANRGQCAQPCRWRYHLVEEKRPGEYFPIVEEPDAGTYILNAKDLCMIQHLDKLVLAGVSSLKIEGRAKSAYYVAVVTNAYRMALEDYLAHPEGWTLPQWLDEEVRKVSHRRYSTGFYFGKPDQYYDKVGYIRTYESAALTLDWQEGWLKVAQRNKFSVGEILEAVIPGAHFLSIPVTALEDENRSPIPNACHAEMTAWLPCETKLEPGIVLRRATGVESM